MDVSKILSREKGLPAAVPSKLDKPTAAPIAPSAEEEFENEGGAIIDEDDEWVMTEEYIKPEDVARMKELLSARPEQWVSITEAVTPSDRHPLAQRFHNLLYEIGQLHDEKQKDYGTKADPFANVRGATEFGLPAPMGAFIAMSDIMSRIKAFCTNGELKNEPLENALKDMAVYSLIALVLYEEENAN